MNLPTKERKQVRNKIREKFFFDSAKPCHSFVKFFLSMQNGVKKTAKLYIL